MGRGRGRGRKGPPEHNKHGSKEVWGKPSQEVDTQPEVEKEKPNFGLSGKLTAETNTFKGVVIKYSEPPEARKPLKFRWRLYPFKGHEGLPVMYIHRQSAYLLGRDRKIADIPIDHPSCSKQHAAIQYRLMPYERPNGTMGRRIKPYIIDLESGNGTFLNGKQIEPKRYYELFEKDALKFGFSSREYILLHENSKDDPLDDEAEAEPEVGSSSPLPAIKSEKKEKKPNLGNLS
jgi:smad nuclear-interacting protein 1